MTTRQGQAGGTCVGKWPFPMGGTCLAGGDPLMDTPPSSAVAVGEREGLAGQGPLLCVYVPKGPRFCTVKTGGSMSCISELGATLALLSPTYLNRHHRGHQEKLAACPCATYSAYPIYMLSAAETRVFPHANPMPRKNTPA